MKAGWQLKAIGAICDVVNGGTPKTGVSEYWDGPHKWITPAEMGKRASPYIAETERTITDLGLQNSSARMLPPHSVILSSRAPIGHLVINTETMATNQGCKGLVPDASVEHKFLYYYLTSIVGLLNDLCTGATFKELSGGKLKEVTIPVPPKSEQRRIVSILDEAFDGIAAAKANAEKNLQNARALSDSYLQSVFAKRGRDWKDKTFGELAEFRNGVNFTKSSRGQTIPILGVRNFQNYFWAPLDALDSVTVQGEFSDGDALKENDLVFVRSNGNVELIGRCVLVGPVKARIAHSGFTIRARLQGQGLYPKYICHFLKSSVARRKMIDSGIGTNIKSLSQGVLADLIVPVPMMDEQRKIVDRLEQFGTEGTRLESIYQRKLAALVELKQSLLHQAFSGAL